MDNPQHMDHILTDYWHVPRRKKDSVENLSFMSEPNFQDPLPNLEASLDALFQPVEDPGHREMIYFANKT